MEVEKPLSIVQKLYEDNIDISEIELAQKILNYPELTLLDLWLLPQYPFNQWRKKYDYPRLIENMKQSQGDFQTWMDEQHLTDDHLLNGYLSDFFENKPLSKDKIRHLIKVSYKGKVSPQSWHSYSGQKSMQGDGEPVLYEFIMEYISYYDWKLLKGEVFNFIDTFDRHRPNTESEQVYLNSNIRLLKMGGTTPPVNGFGIMLRGKKLEFVNASGLSLQGTMYFGTMGNLSFEHSVVDNLKANELDLPFLDFMNCSIRNLQVRNSTIENWLFANCKTGGNIIDSKLTRIRIFGGQFTPTFTNSEILDFEVTHEGVTYDYNFEKTYRTLSKAVNESGNKELGRSLKIKELDFIRKRKKGWKWAFMTIDKLYWQYGQRPTQLIWVMIISIISFGLLYSFFPEDFKGLHLTTAPYWKVIYNTQYYSAVTFTTLGYGDLSPIGPMKLFAAIEALFGAVTLGFLVSGLTRND